LLRAIATSKTLRHRPQQYPQLLVTGLSFQTSRFAALRAYEQGYVKEGVALGGAAILATLSQQWQQTNLLQTIEAFMQRYAAWPAT
jgi:NaMN:DMB phosphoribosyltransferase